MTIQSWIGGSAGSPNNWNDPSNWSSGVAPIDGDTAAVGPALNNPVLDVTTAILASVTIQPGGDLVVTFADGFNVSSTRETNLLAIENGGTLTDNGAATSVGADSGSNGTITVNGPGSLLDGTADFTIGNSGTGIATVSSAGRVNAGSQIVVDNGSLSIESDGIVTGTGSAFIGNAVDSSGQLNVMNGGTLTLTGASLPAGSADIVVGRSTGSAGVLNVDGIGATVDSTGGTIIIGDAGTGTLNVSNGGSIISNSVTIGTSGSIDLSAGTLNTSNLTLSSGAMLSGSSTVLGDVINNGTIRTSGGAMILQGGVTGTGSLVFDATVNTLEVHDISPGQSIVMNGNDTLQLDTPATFAGTIAANVGDTIVLQGVTATSAVDTNGTLVVSNGSTTIASLLLTSSSTNDHFNVAGSTITVAAGTTPIPTPPGTVALHGSHDQYLVTSNNGSLYMQDTVAGRDETQTLPSSNLMTFSDGTGVFDPTGTAEDVDRLYSAALGRTPDVSGLGFWTNAVDGSHVPLSDVAGSFAASPEFIQHYGSLADPAFVQQLYQNVLNRSGDAGGTQFWQDQLAAGVSRGQVVLGFAESAENQAKTLPTAGDKNNAEAYRLYQAALDRAPDQAGQTFWSSALGGGATPDQLAQGFIGSAEFQQKYGSLNVSDFVSQLYQNVLHRAGDPAGQQFWTTQLQQGVSQASVLVGFSDGLENRSQTAGATHDGWVFIPA